MAENIGKVVQVIGPVLDVEFDPEQLPELYTALEINAEGNGHPAIRVVAEVQQHIGRGQVRAVSMSMSITPERLAEFDEDSIALLAKRLDDDDYPTPFDSLSDWHLLRALAIHRPDLTAPYVHLVDQEPFDED